jgi:cytochrome b561
MTMTTRRYNGLAIALHWTIAILILFQIAYAWWGLAPLKDDTPEQAAALAFHFSIGLTILMLSLARLGLRLVSPPPPLPADMPGLEKTLARGTHVLFYLLIIGIPTGGWVLASLGPDPIRYFGLFDWPHLPFLSHLDKAGRHAIGKPVGAMHTTVLVWLTLVLLVLHVGGALKNQLTGPPVLWRMLPFLRRPA